MSKRRRKAKIGYLLPRSSIVAAAVDAHGGAEPALPAITVPPTSPVAARLGFDVDSSGWKRLRRWLVSRVRVPEEGDEDGEESSRGTEMTGG